MQQVRGAVLPQDDIGSGASLSLAQCLTRLIVRLEMRTQVAGVRHDLAAETQPLALIGGQCGFDIGVSRKRIGETLRVECRLGDASNHVRSCNKSGITEERHAAEHDARRFQIEDRLQQGPFHPSDDAGDDRREQPSRARLDVVDDLAPDQGWRDRMAMPAADESTVPEFVVLLKPLLKALQPNLDDPTSRVRINPVKLRGLGDKLAHRIFELYADAIGGLR